MNFRPSLGGALALLMITAAPAADAQEGGGLLGDILPGVFGSDGRQEQRPRQVTPQMAQAGDPRITALEEQIRSLSGTVEELNFQILQLQEQMRKQQEDNEFRFQELEKKSGAVRGKQAPAVAEAPPAAGPTTAEGGGGEAPAGDIESVIITDSGTGQPGSVEKLPKGGEKTFGTIVVDDKGNVRGGTVGEDVPAAGADDTVVAALPAAGSADEVYRNAYEFILSGDYSTAEAGFRDHIARFPEDPRAADARYWLGESLLGQDKYRDAAEVFLSANKAYPSAKKAPDMMLKLGIALVGLNQREVACATFAEVEKRYPDTSGQIKQRVKQEQALAKC
jgi:tol-pal system protein YbgF